MSLYIGEKERNKLQGKKFKKVKNTILSCLSIAVFAFITLYLNRTNTFPFIRTILPLY